LVVGPFGAIPSPVSALAVHGEAHRVQQGDSSVAEGRKGCFCLLQEHAEPRLGGFDPHQRHQRRLATGGILGHGLADSFCIALGVEEVVGEQNPPRVTGVVLRDTKTGAVRRVACEGVFIAIGHTPVTELFKGQLTLDREGYIVTRPDSTATDVPGVFAAGDVKDKVFRQAVTAAGMGCMAALEAEKFLAAHETAGRDIGGVVKAAE